MKLALVHDWLTGMRGGEKCLEVLCRRYPNARLFTLVWRRGTTTACIERMDITTSLLQRLPLVDRYYRWCLPLMPWAVERLAIPPDVNLVLSLSHAVVKGVKSPSAVPHLCYCHTPMRYAWGLREDYFGRAALHFDRSSRRRALRRLAGPTVRLLGWRSDEDIREHLRRCRALLFPGHEDFGIVPVEAQACGAPVIALRRGGATETVLPADARRIGSGVFFEHQTVDSLCEAIRWLESHPERLSSELARQQAQRFAVKHFEQRLVALLERVASGASPQESPWRSAA